MQMERSWGRVSSKHGDNRSPPHRTFHQAREPERSLRAFSHSVPSALMTGNKTAAASWKPGRKIRYNSGDRAVGVRTLAACEIGPIFSCVCSSAWNPTSASTTACALVFGPCHEIVMVARSERIISKQNGSNRLICKPNEKRNRVEDFHNGSEPTCVLLNLRTGCHCLPEKPVFSGI